MPRPALETPTQHHAASAADAMLPEPALTFTIPSIHDDVTTLECRVYHPRSLTPSPRAPPWRRHAAVIAHPYAPLGGCYDDAVVETVAAVLLRQGFVVGTFNFRGAGNSTGRTSWTSKAEKGDYVSFAAFVYYYVHYLDPFRPRTGRKKSPASHPASPTSPTEAAPPVAVTATEPGEAPVLLLCGYSYGAMIIKLLPSLDAVLEAFATPRTASAAADIRLRAQHLAEKQNLILAGARAALTESPTSPRKAAFGLRVGGDEDKRRSQEHGRRSFSIDAEEKIRKGVAELMTRAKSHQLYHSRKRKEPKDNDTPLVGEGEAVAEAAEREPDTLPPVAGLVTPRVAYLLISPPVGWATSLMTMNLGGSVSGFFGKGWSKSPKTKGTANTQAADSKDASTSARQEKQKLLDNPTLVVYGDSDVFVAVKRYREWTSKLQSAPGSKFRAHEVSTAGHFYVEEGTMQRLADAVRVFSRGLLVQGQAQPSGT